MSGRTVPVTRGAATGAELTQLDRLLAAAEA